MHHDLSKRPDEKIRKGGSTRPSGISIQEEAIEQQRREKSNVVKRTGVVRSD